MTAPSPVVTVFFGGSVEGGDVFTLNSNPKGMLNSSTYVLGGDSGTVVNGDAFDIQISRGRSRVFDEFDAGTATVMFRNYSGDYSVLNPDGPYFGNLVPGKKVVINSSGSNPIFTGQAESWQTTSTLNGEHSTRLLLQDDFGPLATRQFTQWTATAGDSPSDRLNTALSRAEVNFGANRDFDEGVTTLQADTVDAGTNVLNYGQLVARSDWGRFFVSARGVLTYRDRHTVGETIVIAGETIRIPPLAFSDDSGDWTETPSSNHSGVIPFQEITTAAGADLLFNRITVERVGGTAQTADDTVSQDLYGIRELNLSGLLLASDLQAANLAAYILGSYKEPRERISSITCNVSAVTDMFPGFGAVTNREIGWMILVYWTPVGASTQREDLLVIDGIDHSISVDEHLVTFRTSQAEESASFILGDTEFGELDNDRLGF